MRKKNPDLMERIRKFAEDFYVEYGRSTYKSDFAEALGISKGTATKYLVEMDELGLVNYDGYNVHTEVTLKCNPKGADSAILDNAVACGPGDPEEEHVLERVRLPEAIFGTSPKFILQAKGDSMVDAGIAEGDWLVISQQNTAKEGDIIVALYEGVSNLKYLYYDHENVCAILRSANKKRNYGDIRTKDLQIQGVLHSVIKNY